MESSTESLLHGDIVKLKSCDQDSLAQQSIVGKRSKNTCLSQRTISFLSFALNLILMTSLLLSWAKTIKSSRSEFAGLVRDVPIKWDPYSPYGLGNKNETNRTIMWESLEVSLGYVSLDNQWAMEHGLPQAQPFPWDKSRGLYSLNSHHSLHCMRKIRRWVTIAYHNGTQLDSYRHLVHCMDHLLQNILCDADDTPIYTTKTKKKDARLYQTRMCRSWDKLNRWAETQTSCYVYINETQDVDTEFSKYKWCPKGSSYAKKMLEHMGYPEGWYEKRPAEIDSMPPYWENFTNNVFTFQRAVEG